MWLASEAEDMRFCITTGIVLYVCLVIIMAG